VQVERNTKKLAFFILKRCLLSVYQAIVVQAKEVQNKVYLFF